MFGVISLLPLQPESMENPASEPLAPQKPSRAGLWIAAALVLAVVAGGLGWWFLGDSQASEEELAAKAELTTLGALPAMDAERIHVNSINLSTLRSPESLGRAIELLADLPNLRSLNVDGTQFSDEHAAAVGQLDSLESLVLSNTPISDTALEKLAGLSELSTLHLVGTGVTDAGMPALARVRSVEILDLSRTKVTKNLAPLREMPDLKHLLLENLTLDAAALNAIANFPAITRVTLREATYPAEALAQLKQKKSGLAIDE